MIIKEINFMSRWPTIPARISATLTLIWLAKQWDLPPVPQKVGTTKAPNESEEMFSLLWFLLL